VGCGGGSGEEGHGGGRRAGLAVRDEVAAADKEVADKWAAEEAAVKRAAEEAAVKRAS
jgi:hypothetical protein